MAELFEPTVLNGVALSNRFVRSATWEGLAAPGGYATEELGRLLMGLAQGKVGLIITGHAYVSSEGQAAPAQLGIHTDGHVTSLKEMVDEVHDAGGKIAVQVSHGGRYALKLPNVVPLFDKIDYSFPSGHATFFMALAVAIFLNHKKSLYVQEYI